jgi:hypothetical protein
LGRNRANIPKRAAIDAALLRLAPAIPLHERTAVVDHAIDSRGLSVALPETAAWLSLVAYVRHTFTDYDDLLAESYDSVSMLPANLCKTVADSLSSTNRAY